MRESWDDYFMKICDLIATRATCDRLHVGALIVKDRRILATGYNGSPPGMAHCDNAGHLLVDNHCRRTIHAEQNAILQCAKFGTPTAGATMYVTHYPCDICAKLIIGAGITRIVHRNNYDNVGISYQIIKEAGIQVDQLG